jgi:hypothetical protein
MSEYLDINIQNGQLYTSDGNKLDINQKECKVVITTPRNIKYHRKIMKMLHYTYMFMKPRVGINSTDRLLLAFKDYSGMFDVIPSKSGGIREYHSISFGSMDEGEFREVAEKIKDFCYVILNSSHCDKKIIESLIKIEF